MQGLPALPDAREETQGIGALLRVHAWGGAQASEPALHGAVRLGAAPRLLHLATHGVFPKAACPEAEGSRRRSRRVGMAPEPASPGAIGDLLGQQVAEPMLNSALTLAHRAGGSHIIQVPARRSQLEGFLALAQAV